MGSRELSSGYVYEDSMASDKKTQGAARDKEIDSRPPSRIGPQLPG